MPNTIQTMPQLEIRARASGVFFPWAIVGPRLSALSGSQVI